MLAQPEIIDLTKTTTSPEIIVINDSDDGDNLTAPTHERVRRKMRKKNKSSQTKLAPSPGDSTNLFFVDLTPASLPMSLNPPIDENRTPGHEQKAPTKLLLPAHVSVAGMEAGEVSIQILPPPSDSDEDSYIEYLDYDNPKANGLVRYFDQNSMDGKPLKFVCKNCGTEGEHRTTDCPIQICLTCGARDEHPTRSCPISKTCFNCGMKGHISRACPNPALVDKHDDCDRCGSRTHKSNECPTLWRLYDYHTDNERLIVLRRRQDRSHLGLGNGGEGYIADDECCYNCGNCGHWGDNCDVQRHPSYMPREPSAFSKYNTMSGPFFDVELTASASRQKNKHYRGRGSNHADDWDVNVPVNVGKQGKKKDRARMEKRAREQNGYEDDDWFDEARRNRRPEARRIEGGRGGRVAPPGDKKLSFGLSVRGAGRLSDPPHHSGHQPHKSTLLNRLGDNLEYPRSAERLEDRLGEKDVRDSSRRHHSHNDSSAGGAREKYRKESGRDHGRDRDKDRNRNRTERDRRGPRYTGGYSR